MRMIEFNLNWEERYTQLSDFIANWFPIASPINRLRMGNELMSQTDGIYEWVEAVITVITHKVRTIFKHADRLLFYLGLQLWTLEHQYTIIVPTIGCVVDGEVEKIKKPILSIFHLKPLIPVESKMRYKNMIKQVLSTMGIRTLCQRKTFYVAAKFWDFHIDRFTLKAPTLGHEEEKVATGNEEEKVATGNEEEKVATGHEEEKIAIPDNYVSGFTLRLKTRSLTSSTKALAKVAEIHDFHSVTYEALLGAPLDSRRRMSTTIISPLRKQADYYTNGVFMLGSCNGLICLAPYTLNNNVLKFVIWNPLTGHRTELSKYGDGTRLTEMKYTYGFGFDSSSNDYKVIVGTYPSLNHRDYSKRYMTTNIISLRNKVWRKPRCSDCSHESGFYEMTYKSTHFNGVLHWIQSRKESDSGRNNNIVLAFDLAQEKFWDIKLPPKCETGDFVGQHSTLGVLKGRLSTSLWQDPKRGNPYVKGGVEIWTMREYGRVESWTLIGKIMDRNARLPKLICFDQPEDTIVITDSYRFLKYNPEDNSYESVEVIDVVDKRVLRMECLSYTESLLCPDNLI
ncbi:hypothetical protein ACFE04_011603 [Oxalis oulophora]